MSPKERQGTAKQPGESRRGLMKNIGKAALAAPPAVTMIMAATSKPAKAGRAYNVPPFGLPPGPPSR